jgi:uncharacterized protein (TIGR03437 family)
MTAVFPANSITLLYFPPAATPVPQPVVAAVTNAASYASAIASRQMVVVWGTSMGPATLTTLSGLDSKDMVSKSLAGVRILFEGVPAPLWYVSATQSATAMPYHGAFNSTTHVRLEYQGVRSAPLAVPVSAATPGICTINASVTGQGSILNQNYGINFANIPAARGSIVSIWATGEGVTDPPGVYGRPAVGVWA